MILYLDTSALLKLYVREPGSRKVRGLVSSAEASATSVVAYPEARAALARLHREGISSDKKHRELIADLGADWEKLLHVGLTTTLIRFAGDTTDAYGLRGFDAIHLASALWLREQSPAALSFVAFDRRLVEAARQAGLPTLP